MSDLLHTSALHGYNHVLVFVKTLRKVCVTPQNSWIRLTSHFLTKNAWSLNLSFKVPGPVLAVVWITCS
jgi:hypothetical protein